jgi:hypothetical protein
VTAAAALVEQTAPLTANAHAAGKYRKRFMG